MKTRDRYHHGDLRAALLEAGRSILTEDGLEALTLRGVAARAGVSYGAPIHHFPTMRHLLTALAVEGFERFGQALSRHRGQAPQDARSQVAAVCDAYIGFVDDQPHWFRLIFSLSGQELNWEDEGLERASRAAYAALREVATVAATARGETGPSAVERIALLIWTSVHGYAQLKLSGRIALGAAVAPPRPSIEALLFGDRP